MAKCSLKNKEPHIRSKKPLKWDLQILKNIETKVVLANNTKGHVKIIDGQKDWNSIKEGILNTANTTLKNEKLIPRKPWITQLILVLIKERNNH